MGDKSTYNSRNLAMSNTHDCIRFFLKIVIETVYGITLPYEGNRCGLYRMRCGLYRIPKTSNILSKLSVEYV